MRISRWFSAGNIIAAGFGLLAVCGVVLEAQGSVSPVIFALTMVTSTVALSMMRPPTANLLLSQQEGDTGSAASLINFTAMFMGSVGMFLISLESGSLIASIGLMQIIVGTVCA